MEEHNQMKVLKNEIETKLTYSDEKTHYLQNDLSIKSTQVMELEMKYSKTQEELDNVRFKYHDAQRTVTELNLRVDANNSETQSLKNERHHLDLACKEARSLKDILEKKNNKLEEEKYDLLKRYQEATREVLGFDEIRKEKDNHIGKLKKELERV